MVSLFIVYPIHIYVNLYCVYTYIQYIHTVILFVDTGSGYRAGLVLIVQIMYSIAASMASD